MSTIRERLKEQAALEAGEVEAAYDGDIRRFAANICHVGGPVTKFSESSGLNTYSADVDAFFTDDDELNEQWAIWKIGREE